MLVGSQSPNSHFTEGAGAITWVPRYQADHSISVSLSPCHSREAASLPGSDTRAPVLGVCLHPHPSLNLLPLICPHGLNVALKGLLLLPLLSLSPLRRQASGEISIHLHFPAASYFSSSSSLAPALVATRKQFSLGPPGSSVGLNPLTRQPRL